MTPEQTLPDRLRLKSNMINMGEGIAWGSETALMDEAAAHIIALRAQLVIAEAQAPTGRIARKDRAMDETTTKNLIARLMQHVEDTMCEAKVDYFPRHRAGARVSYERDFLQTCFENELDDALAREAALTVLVNLNENHGPFGGEIYQDRVERAWDNARALVVKP